jgi:hypothetical protein
MKVEIIEIRKIGKVEVENREKWRMKKVEG